MKRAVSTTLLALFLSGCGPSDQKESNSKIVHNQIGRFTILPANQSYPAMLLDTATGCVMTVELVEGHVSMDEVNFVGGTSSCSAMKQLLVTDTLSRISK